MWFIIRTAFCVGIVFSMTPGGKVIDDIDSAPAAALIAVATPAMREHANGALSACRGEPNLCLEAARRFASLGNDALAPVLKAAAPDGTRFVADTLTASDRVAPWRGNARDAHGRATSRPGPNT